jgi:uncharacterized repeat protein (TIGR01451 family)
LRCHYLRFIAVTGALAVAACSSDPPPVGTATAALFSDNGFESDTAGAAPAAPWTVSANLNGGYKAGTPAQLSDLQLQNGGTKATTVVGGATGSQPDPDLGAGQVLRYPKYGTRSAVVNWSSTTIGKNKNSNTLSQTMTVAAGDFDPSDGQYHTRFVVAPVLQKPGHTADEEPYFFIQLTNVTRGGTIIYHNFDFSDSVDVPWQTDATVAGGAAVFTDWQLVDIAPGNANVAIGDSVTLTVVASGCALGGHWGRLYVDAFGANVPGVFVSATAPQSANAGSNITYTFKYENGGSVSASGTEVDLALPSNTTFVSSAGGSCTNNAGQVTCAIGNVPAGGFGTFTVTVQIAAAATGTITLGNYSIKATGISPLLGPAVQTTITNNAKFADVSATMTGPTGAVAPNAAIGYTLTVSNAGPNATTATVADAIPAQLTNWAWTCVGAGGATCGASGNAAINDAASLPSGGSVTYTITAKTKVGSSGTVTNNATATVTGAGITDPDTSNNSASVTNQIGTLDTLTITKNGSGTVTSSPSGINCGATCSTSFADGAQVVLGAAPASGSVFVSWGGACASAGSAPQCTLTMAPSTAVTANFAVACTAMSCAATPATPVCDPSIGVCVRCTQASDCATGAMCVSDSCVEPAPVLTAPTGNTVNTEPPMTGTTTPGATITLYLDGSATAYATVVADNTGAFTYTPTTVIALGAHTLTATATAGSPAFTSAVSNTLNFTIVQCTMAGQCPAPDVCNTTTHSCVRCVPTDNPSDCPAGATCNNSDQCVLAAPVVTTPVNNSSSAITTPTIAGTSVANAKINITVYDSATPTPGTTTGTTTAVGKNWTTVWQALPAGTYTVNATATVGVGVAAVTSPVSNTNTFTIKCAGNANCVGSLGGPICNTTTGVCGNTCVNDGDCGDPTFWCASGTCTPKTVNGQPVTSAGGFNGTCTMTSMTGSGPRTCLSGVCDVTNNECGLTNGKMCGAAGVCDSNVCFGDSLCGDPNGQSCASAAVCRSNICFSDNKCGLPNGQTCSSNIVCRTECVGADDTCGLINGTPCAQATQCRSNVCNADGHCGDPDGTPCASALTCRSAICSTGTCGSMCKVDGDCASGNYCDTTSGACKPQEPNSHPCTRPAMCSSGECNGDGMCGDPDGHGCVNATTCRSALCNAGNTCGGTCTTDAQCIAADYCNGGSCTPDLPNAMPCTRVAMCASGICNADGKCGQPTGEPCATASVCRSNVCDATFTCAAACATDSNCNADQYCDAGSSTCKPALPNGMMCTRATMCASGLCDGDGMCGAVTGEPCGSNLLCRSNNCTASQVCGAVVVITVDMANPDNTADMAGADLGGLDMSAAGDMSGAAGDMSVGGGDMSSAKKHDMSTAPGGVAFSGGGFCSYANSDSSSNGLAILFFGAFLMLLSRRRENQ